MNTPLNIAILAVPEVTASTAFGMFDLFAAAGRDWDLIRSVHWLSVAKGSAC